MALQQQTRSRCELSARRKAGRSRGVFPDGPSLFDARKSKGLTQEQLAAIADVDVKTIRKGESTQRLDVASLKRIATALGLELPSILADHSALPDDHEEKFEVIKCWQRAWNGRDLRSTLNCYDINAVISLPGAPTIPFSGQYTGHTSLTRVYKLVWSLLRSEPCRQSDFFYAYHSKQVALRSCCPIMNRRGDETELTCTHIFQIQEFKIIEHLVDYDTLLISQLLQ